MAPPLATIQKQISTLALRWKAAITVNSNHTPEQAKNRTGYVPGPGKPSLQEREQISIKNLTAVAQPAAPPAAATATATAVKPDLQKLPISPIRPIPIHPIILVPAAFDWRSHNGGDYVTPITDQGGCGSCVAFGSIASMESWIRIAYQNPAMAVDKSEAHLWFCYGPAAGAGACPGGGWWPDPAYSAMQQGITDASCFQYTAANQPCNLCASWEETLTHTTGWHTISSGVQDIKAYIAEHGPVTTCFTVYEDFYYYYTGGVYTYNAQTAGAVVGGHCVCIVGYDDTQSCWILKNSWGTGWGESGFFQMSYGSCGIDAEVWAIEGIVIPAAVGQGSRIDGYQTSFNNQQHVNFIGTDGHVHELYYTNQWSHNDLTAAAGAPNAAAGSPLDGYETAYSSQQHVNYLGTDGHVHELYYASSWAHNDLTVAGGAPAAAAWSSLDGYATTFNNQQHVNFIGANCHVYELVYTDHWACNDLTQITNATNTVVGSPLDGYETTFNNQQHVNYIGEDGHVHEFVYTDHWAHNDLTADAGAPAVMAGSGLDGYQTSFNSQQHVNFIGPECHVYELVYTDHWAHNDLTQITNAPVTAQESALDGYQTTFNNQQHVNYLGTDGHIHELVYTDHWSHNDLTADAGAPGAMARTPLDGYQTTFNNQQHVNYIGADGQIHELVYTNRWSDNDLSEVYH